MEVRVALLFITPTDSYKNVASNRFEIYWFGEVHLHGENVSTRSYNRFTELEDKSATLPSWVPYATEPTGLRKWR